MILPFAAPFAFNPVAAVIAGAWKWIVAAVVAGGLLSWILVSAYRHGEAHERAIWNSRAAQVAMQAAHAAELREAAKSSAEISAAHRAETYANAHATLTREVLRYVQAPAAVAACPDADGVHLGAAAIAAANAALTAR
jgi:hypothetical protein